METSPLAPHPAEIVAGVIALLVLAAIVYGLIRLYSSMTSRHQLDDLVDELRAERAARQAAEAALARVQREPLSNQDR